MWRDGRPILILARPTKAVAFDIEESQTMHIERLTSEQTHAYLPDLIRLLQDSVDGGASVGFLPPLSDDQARQYWSAILPGVEKGSRILLVALDEGEVIGTAQLDLAQKPNALHRAEVQKLMVHSAHRGKGIAGELLVVVETAARQAKRTLLVLDTIQGDTADRLYRKLGWIEAGVIPQYAMGAAGILEATVVFYKILNV
jgi:acetyltransferase